MAVWVASSACAGSVMRPIQVKARLGSFWASSEMVVRMRVSRRMPAGISRMKSVARGGSCRAT